MSYLIDSNIIIDLITPASEWFDWSSEKVFALSENAPLFINQMIYAEISPDFRDYGTLDQQLIALGLQKEDLPWEAGFLAGQAFLQYRQNKGTKTSPMPDFYIGAHAQYKGHKLLTRDARRYRAYFPDLDLIAPDEA